jgi:hypothetical protein
MAQFIEMVPLAEEAIPLLEEGAAATGRILSRVGGRVARTAAGRAIAAEARAAARSLGYRQVRSAIARRGVPRSFGAKLAEEAGYAGRAGVRALGRAYRVARKNPLTALGIASQMYGARKLLRGKRKLKSRPMPNKKKKRKIVLGAPRRMTGGALDLGKVRFRKGGPPRGTKMVSHTYDEDGSSTADRTSYLKFQNYGGSDKFSKCFADGLTRAILAIMRLNPSSLDEEMVVPGFDFSASDPGVIQLKITYQRLNVSGVPEDTVYTYQINGSGTSYNTFRLLRDQLATGFWDTVSRGYYPVFFDVIHYRGSIEERQICTRVPLNNARIQLMVKTRIDIQNQTQAASTGAGNEDVASRLNIHSQPLHGRRYDFNHRHADILDRLHEVRQTTEMAAFETHDHTNGFTSFASNSHEFNEPPRAKAVFANCIREANLHLSPGEVKKQYVVFKYSGTVKGLYKKFCWEPNSGYAMRTRLPGGCTVFGFERQLKAGTAQVELGFHRHTETFAHVQIRKEKFILHDHTDDSL